MPRQKIPPINLFPRAPHFSFRGFSPSWVIHPSFSYTSSCRCSACLPSPPHFMYCTLQYYVTYCTVHNMSREIFVSPAEWAQALESQGVFTSMTVPALSFANAKIVPGNRKRKPLRDGCHAGFRILRFRDPGGIKLRRRRGRRRLLRRPSPSVRTVSTGEDRPNASCCRGR